MYMNYFVHKSLPKVSLIPFCMKFCCHVLTQINKVELVHDVASASDITQCTRAGSKVMQPLMLNDN